MVDVDRLRSDLLTARKQRDDIEITALRTAIAALENAAAPPAQHRVNMFGDTGPTEVPRLVLTEAQRFEILRAEIAEAELAAKQYEEHGQEAAAIRLRAECAVLARYLASPPPE